MIKRNMLASLLAILAIASLPSVAHAHVVVTPNQANIGQEIVFNVSVPNEKTSSEITAITLRIPNSVTNVTPTGKEGWTISTTQSSTNGPEITAISWTGSIPVGQRQDFSFSAQIPAQPTELDWKAFQTYADGSIVHWDQAPTGSDDASGDAGPYSVTKVIDDLSSANPSSQHIDYGLGGAYLIASLALVLAISAFFRKRWGPLAKSNPILHRPFWVQS